MTRAELRPPPHPLRVLVAGRRGADRGAEVQPRRAHDLHRGAARHGMPALAMTDHGAMFGTLKFYEAARAVGHQADHRRRGLRRPGLAVRPHTRASARRSTTTSPCSPRTRPATATSSSSSRQAYLEGFYHRPRMDKQLLAEHAEGVLCLSGLPVLRARRAARRAGSGIARARRAADLPRHLRRRPATSSSCRTTASPISARSCATQVELGARASASRVVATNDLHYTRPEDAKPHDVLLCIQQQKLQSDPKRLKFDAEDFYLKSAAEMRARLRRAARRRATPRSRSPSACELLPRARARAGRGHDASTACRGSRRRPASRSRATSASWSSAGAVDRYGDPLPTEVIDRIDHELSIISKMGFAGYFLIVWDLIRFAREQGIRVGPGPRDRRRARSCPTRCGSPTSIRCATGCCSSGS